MATPLDIPTESLVGQLVGGTYEIQSVIGEGGFGTVYAARHVRLQRSVAVKILRTRDSEDFRRFRREAEITSSLGSRHIAQVFDFNTLESGAPYMVMELLQGEDLGRRLARQGTIGLGEALRICEQVAVALSIAHRHRIIHRDMKPQNIFLCRSDDEGEVVKVIDFGISKVLVGDLTQTQGVVGTPLYMSPEQLSDRSELIDERADVYALAAVLYRALAGSPPFPAQSLGELIRRLVDPETPPPSLAGRQVPATVDVVLRRALRRQRDLRPGSVLEFYNEFANAARASAKIEAATPAAAIVGTLSFGTTYITGMVTTPLWRGRGGKDDELRFMAPDGGFVDEDQRPRSLILSGGRKEFRIGSVPSPGEEVNDLVLPHPKVSRSAVQVTVRDGRVYLKRLPRCSVPVRVGLALLERGEERPLHHGHVIAVGVVPGLFLDGRFVPSQVPAQTVDDQTGLLGREGLAWELALAARLGEATRLLLGQATGEAADDEAAACRAALALHQTHPGRPVARFGPFFAILVGPATDIAALVDIAARAAGMPLLAGHLEVGGTSDEAGVRIDEARGALQRLAATGMSSGLVDLGAHPLPVRDPGRFTHEAHEITRRGGQVVLFAIEETARLWEIGPLVVPTLELELLQVVGRLAGAEAIVARPAPGVIACAAPTGAPAVAQQIAAEWHGRGPIRGEILEVPRSLSVDLVPIGEGIDFARRAADLAAGTSLAAGVEGLPLPIAARGRLALAGGTALARAAALTDLVVATWRFAAVILGSTAMALRPPRPPTVAPEATAWPSPWRDLAGAAARTLARTGVRIDELLAAFADGRGGEPSAIERATQGAQLMSSLLADPQLDLTAVHRELPRLEALVGELLAALRPLRGWTLVAVERVDRLDLLGDCETVHYVDYTGTFERGTPRQVTLVRDLRMGPFVYLSRFAEGIVVPLEPLLRRRLCPTCAQEELFWAEAPIVGPGRHRYRSLLAGHPLDEEVALRQLPRGARG